MMLEVESLVPVKELLEVKVERTTMTLTYDTAVSCKLSVIHVADSSTSCLIHSNTRIEGKLEVLEESYLSISCSVDSITLRVVCIKSYGSERIHITIDRTRQTGIHTITKVIHLKTVRVDLDASVCISHVYRVDWSHRGSIAEDVT